MKIVTQSNPSLHSIGFCLVIPKGSIDEPKNRDGITHLIEHLFFRRAKERSQKEIYGCLESMGVKIDAKTGRII